MQKFYPIKSCSCSSCKNAKNRKYTKPIERRFRRLSKVMLQTKLEEFDNMPFRGGYPD